MERKIYETLGKRARLNLPVTVGERVVRVEFSNGGLTSAGNGRYITCDEAIQQALEKCAAFGKSFILKDTVKIKEAVRPVVVPLAKSTVEGDGYTVEGDGYTVKDEDQNPNPTDEDSGEQLPTPEDDLLVFENFNQLRDYLITEHKCTASSVRSMPLAMEAAKQLGLNVEISK